MQSWINVSNNNIDFYDYFIIAITSIIVLDQENPELNNVAWVWKHEYHINI